MRVYILTDPEDIGTGVMRGTADPDKLPAMIEDMVYRGEATWRSAESIKHLRECSVRALPAVLEEAKRRPGETFDLFYGMEGLQITVLDLEE